MSRHRFEAYLNKVFDFSDLVRAMPEGRRVALAKRIGSISDDTIGYALQRQSPESVFALLITGLVLVMMWIVEHRNVLTAGKWRENFAPHRWPSVEPIVTKCS